MDTTAAAKTAKVTVATIRHWCRMGAVAAERISGRWEIDAASLTHRIATGNRHLAGKSSRVEKKVRPARQIGWNFNPYAAYVAGERIGTYATREAADLAIATWRPAKPAATPKAAAQPAPRGWSKYSRRDTFVHQEMEALTGTASPTEGTHACHYCGLDERTCDCI